jgi:dephospho-CoA kinase
MSPTLKIGLTGGIGSGKSMVAAVFRLLGVPVYDADTAAKQLMETDPLLREAIRAHFGAEAYTDDTLNRTYIAGIVFNDPAKLTLLNSLVHPATIRDSEAWTKRQSYPYTIKEAALLFESESFHHLDKIIGVNAPKSLRLERAMKRDNATREAILARMGKQINNTIKMRLCDYVIVNDEQLAVIPQVIALHETLLKLATNTNPD